MNGRYVVLVATAVLVVVVAAACAPTATAPAQPPSGAVGQPVAAVELAPLCQGGTACQAPSAEQNEIECVNKIPYTNVLVEPGTAFEVLDKTGDFTCNDSGTVVDGKSVLTCYGRELYAFDLKLTNTACGGAGLQAGTGRCQEGYGYDTAQQCCAPVGGDAPGSVVVRVELGACPLPH
ncbi:MAG: hypothetical protein V1755_13670 [Chloroflexota bacterium]